MKSLHFIIAANFTIAILKLIKLSTGCLSDNQQSGHHYKLHLSDSEI